MESIGIVEVRDQIAKGFSEQVIVRKALSNTDWYIPIVQRIKWTVSSTHSKNT